MKYLVFSLILATITNLSFAAEVQTNQEDTGTILVAEPQFSKNAFLYIVKDDSDLKDQNLNTDLKKGPGERLDKN